LVFCKIINY